jgi:hypothetical protein
MKNYFFREKKRKEMTLSLSPPQSQSPGIPKIETRLKLKSFVERGLRFPTKKFW